MEKFYDYGEELLSFYLEAGVDCALSEQPINRLEEPVNPAQVTERTTAAARKRVPIISESLVESTQQLVARVETLDELRKTLEDFDGCALKFTAKNTCFADGTPGSALMIIGEAPGREEDLQGLPFVGRSGQLLNKMLAAIELTRSDVYIANTIPWRPPGNRTPTPLEIEICRPFIERQIELANPKLLLAVGGPAAHALTGSKLGILRLRGKWFDYQTPSGKIIPVLATLHPAYLLRMPAQKKLAWYDLLEVKMRLQSFG